jgi:hypothetical protein
MASETTSTVPLSNRGITMCRGCHASALVSILDLDVQPLANELLPTLTSPESLFPLHLRICVACGLGQVGEFVLPDRIFRNYPYLSSVSTSWVAHAGSFAVRMTRDLGLGASDLVVDVASNDGYLLRKFMDLGVPVLGVEPAQNIATIAQESGVETLSVFLGVETARQIVDSKAQPRLVTANNVLAHVPDLDDFVGGLSVLCGPRTVITVENPSFLNLLRETQFDTIYHEHFSYLSVTAVRALVARHDLELVRVEELPTHGGSYRYWIVRRGFGSDDGTVAVAAEREVALGLLSSQLWGDFEKRSRTTISGFREWLDQMKESGSRIAAYGAAAKGNTLMNAAKVSSQEIGLVADGSIEKQGKYLPGSRIAIVAPSELAHYRPSELLILPWNLASEISAINAELLPDAQCWKAVPTMTRLGVS